MEVSTPALLGYLAGLPPAQKSGRSCSLGGRAATGNELDELANLDLMLEGVAKVGVGMDAVAVAPPFLFVRKVPVSFEVTNDPLGRTLRDSNTSGNVAEPDVRCFGNQDEHPGVIGEKRPGASMFGGQWSTPVL